MSLRDYTKWNTRASLLYALGVWTMIGSVGIYKYMGYDVVEGKSTKKNQWQPPIIALQQLFPSTRVILIPGSVFPFPYSVVKREEEPENPNRVVHSTPHSKTVIIYKENFVPYHTRIYNFFNGSDGK